jgi:hypothetical protein
MLKKVIKEIGYKMNEKWICYSVEKYLLSVV